jgi:hypothetical protein
VLSEVKFARTGRVRARVDRQYDCFLDCDREHSLPAPEYSFYWQDWFIEPSAGIIISRIKVDPFNFLTAGPPFPAGTGVSGTLQLNDIHSDIGRLGLRFGTTVNAGNVIWQPFAAVSVWHELRWSRLSE